MHGTDRICHVDLSSFSIFAGNGRLEVDYDQFNVQLEYRDLQTAVAFEVLYCKHSGGTDLLLVLLLAGTLSQLIQ